MADGGDGPCTCSRSSRRRRYAKLEQFPVNPRCAPERIVAAHCTNQGSNFLGHSGAPRLSPSNFPRPEQAEALAVPTNHRRRFHNGDGRLPFPPNRRQPRPEQPISELSASVASPTVAELRADDEGPESQIEGPRDCERKPRRPPPALQMAANIEIESSEATLNLSATSGFARTTIHFRSISSRPHWIRAARRFP